MTVSRSRLISAALAAALAGSVNGLAAPAWAHSGDHDTTDNDRPRKGRVVPHPTYPGQMRPGYMHDHPGYMPNGRHRHPGYMHDHPGYMQPGQHRYPGRMGPDLMRRQQ
jgi:hypothetical protein